MPDLKRVERELRQCKTDTSSNVTVEPINDNLCHLVGILNSDKGCFKGPEGTCYQGGIFYVDIVIPDQYPFKPPKVCLEILNMY
jgi:ubiquitin-protein ligase